LVFSENDLKGLKNKFKINTMFVIQNPRNLSLMNIDKFIERKKIIDPVHYSLSALSKKQVFLFVDATLFDKENSKKHLEFCYLDIFMVKLYFFSVFFLFPS